jgi:hypothetical protein
MWGVCGVLIRQSEEEWSKYGIHLLCAYESKIGVLGGNGIAVKWNKWILSVCIKKGINDTNANKRQQLLGLGCVI